MTDIRLFQIHSRANLRGFRNVPIDWFVVRRERPLFGPCGSLGVEVCDLIQDYMGGYHGYDAADRLGEYFTETEARAFVDWVRVHRNDDTATIEQANLPIANCSMAFNAIPVGGEQDFLMIGEAADYDLPFTVDGYFDVRFCEQQQEKTS
jgi:hypothetical protein